MNTAHIPRKAMMENYKAFNVGTNITTAAKLYALEACFLSSM